MIQKCLENRYFLYFHFTILSLSFVAHAVSSWLEDSCCRSGHHVSHSEKDET